MRWRRTLRNSASDIVEQHAGGELPARDPVAAVHREHERQRPDQVGRDAQQDAPLPVRFEDQAELALLQVAQPAVDQPAGA